MTEGATAESNRNRRIMKQLTTGAPGNSAPSFKIVMRQGEFGGREMVATQVGD
jgi:hypothetical protein